MTLKAKTPHALLDTLRVDLRLRNDAALAEYLGISKGVVSGIRTGKGPLTDGVRVIIMRKCKVSMRRLDELSPP